MVSAPVGSTTSTGASSSPTSRRPRRSGSWRVMFSGRMPNTTCRPGPPSRAPFSPAILSTVGLPPLAIAMPGPPSAATVSAGKKVHRRRAHEAGDEHVRRALVDLARLGVLLQQALMHDGDARGERHRLHLVVRDVDGGLVEPLVEFLDLRPHLDAELGVEVGERLVEEEQHRIAHQRAAHGDALPLAAGKLARLAVAEGLRCGGGC